MEPELDITYGDPDNPITDPTPDDPLDKDDILIHNLEELLKLLQDQQVIDQDFDAANNAQTQTNFDGVNSKLQSLIDQGAAGDTTLGDSNTQIIKELQTIQTQNSELLVGSNTTVYYGLIFIPLVIITWLFWRFFRTFIRVV